MSNLNYKNPLSPLISLGSQTSQSTSTFGTTFSVLNTGGFMEVYTLNDLIYTIPSGSLGDIEFSGNTIPIQFWKGTGGPFSFDSLTLNWGINEGVDSSDYYTHQKAFRKNNGFLFQAETKPPTPASYLKNSTDISNLFGKGFYAWDEPLPFEEGYEHHGGHAKKSDNSVYLSNDFNPKNYGTFHYNAQIGYDYVARSLNKLSKFNEYLNDVKGFKKVPYYIGNSRFDGDKLLPASAEFYKLPIVRVKKHSQKNEWLLFILNHHLNHYDKQIVKIEIDGKYLEVELNGQFARVEKVVLQ
jgi:hypothetical protein